MNSWTKKALILALVAGSLSCMKQPELDDEITPASLEEVQNALVDGWGSVSPLTMLKKDFIYQETEQQLDSYEPRLALQEGITITDIVEDSTKYLYKFAYQANVINADGTSKPWSREDSREVMKPSASTDSALKVAKLNLHKLSSVQTMSDDLQMTLGFERLIMLAHSCEMTDELQKYCVENLKVDSCEIKCGNLSSVAEVRDAPPLIAKQTNCGGLKDCKLNVKKVTFDWTIILKTGQNVEKQKVSYTLAMTQDLPFLSRVLDYCSRGLVQIPNSSSKVLVTVCNRVKNFERDTATP